MLILVKQITVCYILGVDWKLFWVSILMRAYYDTSFCRGAVFVLCWDVLTDRISKLISTGINECLLSDFLAATRRIDT